MQVTGHRSQVTGHRSQVTGHRKFNEKSATLHQAFHVYLFALFLAKSQSGICLAWTTLSSFVLGEKN